MSNHRSKIDRFFLACIMILTAAGFVIFLSASLGLLARDGADFQTVAVKQAISLVIGLVGFYVMSKLDYIWLRKFSLLILIGAILINLLLFIPSLAFHYNGASRWIVAGSLTFQPSEFLKIAFLIYLAAWAYSVKDRIRSAKFGLLPYLILMAILSALLLTQRDTDTLVIIGATGLVIMFIAGMPRKHVFVCVCLGAIAIAGVVYIHPYALDRFQTYFNRGADEKGSGYQINQSLIAIGSGQITGRGFGQSVQKFGYLPQPTDDSIFAVAAEEFGFIGSTILIILYAALAISIFRISTRAPDAFGGLVVAGIGILVIIESFMNISAMLGLLPLSGVPLLFVSHGGTALIITLTTAGIVANVSKKAMRGARSME